MAAKPYGIIDPNSQHQLWSRWSFVVSSSRRVPLVDVQSNAARWLRKGFGSVGRARVEERMSRRGYTYLIIAEVEGVLAHDPGYIGSVERAFTRFVEQGWGPLARGYVNVKILAGDVQDGRPAQQLVVLPRIDLAEMSRE